MNLPTSPADLPADAPRWNDRNSSVWAEVDGDHLVLVEHDGKPVPLADPIPKATVTRQWGPLTATGALAASQVEIPEAAVLAVARKLYPDFDKGSVPGRHYAREEATELLAAAAPHLTAERAAEVKHLTSLVAHLVFAATGRYAFGESPESQTDRAVKAINAMLTDDEEILAERNAELTRLREREAAWQAHVTDLVATLANIEHLAWKGLDKGWDVLEEIYQTMTPRLPDVLADATSAPEASQSEAATPPPAN